MSEKSAIDEQLRTHPNKRGAWVVDRADALVTLRGLGDPAG